MTNKRNKYFYAIGILEEPTNEAFDRKSLDGGSFELGDKLKFGGFGGGEIEVGNEIKLQNTLGAIVKVGSVVQMIGADGGNIEIGNIVKIGGRDIVSDILGILNRLSNAGI